jgi:hypothetical protein
LIGRKDYSVLTGGMIHRTYANAIASPTKKVCAERLRLDYGSAGKYEECDRG